MLATPKRLIYTRRAYNDYISRYIVILSGSSGKPRAVIFIPIFKERTDFMPRGKAMRRPNGSGTIIKMSGKRRKPFEVRVNTRINEWGYPVYDVLGRYENRLDADIALAEYNRNPFDVKKRGLTFEEVYQMWFQWKYENSAKTYSKSSIACTKGAFQKCASLHGQKITELRTGDMQKILDDHTLSHAYMEHIANLLHQMFKYASEYDIIDKDYSKFIRITKAEDDEAGVPFTKEEIHRLWQNESRVPYADTVLILIYTGWRISELLSMHTENVSLTEWTMTGGVKTAAGKNRIVPIHSGIKHLIQRYHKPDKPFFINNPDNGRAMTKAVYYRLFDNALAKCRIEAKHTPHDCRHTFTSLLDSAGANEVCIDRLVGHASKSLTKRTYTHKDIEELRTAVELIKIEPLE